VTCTAIGARPRRVCPGPSLDRGSRSGLQGRLGSRFARARVV